MNKIGGKIDLIKNIDFSDVKVKVVIAVVLIVLVLIILNWTRSESLKETLLGKFRKKKKAKKKIGKKSRSKREQKRASRKTSVVNEDDEFESESESEEEGSGAISNALRADAEELYNLVHEGLAKGMQQDEFEKIAGELADDYSFIELKQLYNSCLDRNMDPLKSIDVTDYIRILQKEDDDEDDDF